MRGCDHNPRAKALRYTQKIPTESSVGTSHGSTLKILYQSLSEFRLPHREGLVGVEPLVLEVLIAANKQADETDY